MLPGTRGPRDAGSGVASHTIRDAGSGTRGRELCPIQFVYGINIKGLPVIVIYPDYSEKSDIAGVNGIKEQVKDLWDLLPIFRDSMLSVATLHIPYKKNLIQSALNDTDFMVNTMGKANVYYYST